MFRSERRRKIAALRADGKTVAEISEILGIHKHNLSATLAHMRKRGAIPSIPLEEARRRQKEAVNKRHIDPKIILELHKQGLSQDAIAKKLKQRKGYVASVLKNIRKAETKAFREKLIILYERGLSYESMAKILNSTLGCCAVTVNRLVKQGKLQHRPRSRPQEKLPKPAPKETTQGFVVFPIEDRPVKLYRKLPK
jgi:transposase